MGKKTQALKKPDTYQKNMQALSRRYPEAAAAIDRAAEGDGCRLVVVGKERLPNLWLNNLEAFYYAKNPWADATEQLQKLNIRNARLAVFLGFGLGYQFGVFMEHYLKKNNTEHILIIEEDPGIFKAALRVADMVNAINDPRVTFMVGVPLPELQLKFSSYLRENKRFIYLKALQFIYHTTALRLKKDYYLQAVKDFREAARFEVLRFGNDPEDSLIGVRNMLENIVEIVKNPGINLLYDKFKKRPAVIVSTGPSLNKNKHLLKGLEDRALIICPDASLKILLEMGVRPHLVTSLERVKEVVKLVEGFDRDTVRDVYLAACPVVVKEVYRTYPGPRVIVFRDFDHFRWLGIERGILKIMQSSGNMAFKIAEALGCDPIILIGQDLAFSRDGSTHAQGAAYGDKQKAFYNGKTMEVMGNDGKPILTSETWYMFLQAYERDVAQYKGTCINSTEGGAYIKGTLVMPFQEAINKYISEEFYPLQKIKKYLEVFDTVDIEAEKNRLLDLITSTLSDLEGIVEYCRQGLDSYNKYEERLRGFLAGNCAGEITRESLVKWAEEVITPRITALREYHSTFQLFLMHIVQSFFINFEMDILSLSGKYDTQEEVIAAQILAYGKWYDRIKGIVEICKEMLVKAREDLQKM